MNLWLPNIIKKDVIEHKITSWLKSGGRPYEHLIQQQIYSLYPQLHSHQILYIAHVNNNNLIIETPFKKDGKPYKINQCNICFEEDNIVRSTLPCNHTFHLHCISKWFRIGNSSCPMCRLNCNNIYD